MENEDFLRKQIADSAKNHFTNREAEKAVIGCFLNDFEYCRPEFESLTPEDLTIPVYRLIAEAIRGVLKDNLHVDLVTVSDQLPKISKDEKEISYALSTAIECASATPTSTVCQSYMQIIKHLSSRRQAIALTTELQRQLQDPTQDVNAIMDRLRVNTGNLIVSRHAWVPMQDVIMNTYTYLEQRTTGKIKSITTGIKNMDDLIGGFFAGELTVIGARPAVGKSVFGMNIAMAAARDGFHVGVCSREMSDIQYGQRILSYVSRVDGAKLRRAELEDEDWTQLSDKIGMAANMSIDFLFSVRTIEDLRAEVQKKTASGRIDMLIVDYLQLMNSSQRFEADRLRVGHISESLKSIAMDFHIPVIALAQVKRYAGGARAKMPTLEDLKDSGSIEQDADGVIFLHNPYDADDEYVDPRDRADFETYKRMGMTYLCVGVAKQRQGPTGKVCLLFDKSTMHYHAIDRNSEG